MATRTRQLLVAAAYGVLALEIADAQTNQDCTVTINGQTVNVNPDGSFLLSNVPAGTNLVRVSAVCNRPDVTLYGTSEFFEVVDQQTFNVENIPLWPTPPLSLRLARAVHSPITLTDNNLTGQVEFDGFFSDGGVNDITDRVDGSTYRSSNRAIVDVDIDGMVTAVDTGLGFITLTNEGTTSVTPILVSLNDPLTTVEGFVVLEEDGTPVEGASLRIAGLPGFTDDTDDRGHYSISGVPTRLTSEYTIRASVEIAGEDFVGTIAGVVPVPGAFTDAGIIELAIGGGSNGPIIVSGMDPEDHGFPSGPGGDMIFDMLNFCVENSGIHDPPDQIVMLGGVSSIAANVQLIVDALGYTVTHFFGADIETVDLDPLTTPYDVIYMPTGSADNGGGISTEDIARVNARGEDVIGFQAAGGGIVAFAQNNPGGFGWFPLGGLETTSNVTGNGITLTDAGRFILRESATQVEPFHQGFTGPEGFFGLDVLAHETFGNMYPLIIGGLPIIEE